MHRVHDGDREWWANCAWDALAIPLLVGTDARIESEWLDDGTPLCLEVRAGALTGAGDGAIHFARPARFWWDDIVET